MHTHDPGGAFSSVSRMSLASDMSGFTNTIVSWRNVPRSAVCMDSKPDACPTRKMTRDGQSDRASHVCTTCWVVVTSPPSTHVAELESRAAWTDTQNIDLTSKVWLSIPSWSTANGFLPFTLSHIVSSQECIRQARSVHGFNFANCQRGRLDRVEPLISSLLLLVVDG